MNNSYTTHPNHSTADTILYNGKIITVDKNFSFGQAVAIRDGKFIAVGSDKELKAYLGPKTKTIDLEKKSVTPGIIDSHTHPLAVGNNLLSETQTSDITCLQDIFDRLQKAQNQVKPDEWITTARNWYMGQVERRPTLAELDAVTPKNPLWLPLGAHEGFINSLGMKLAGITKNTDDPKGGVIYKDTVTGEPTGHLRSTAMRMVIDLLPPIDPIAGLKKGVHYYNSIGVTSVGHDGVGMNDVAKREYEAYQKIKHTGDLTLRTVIMLMIDPSMSLDTISGMIGAIAHSGLERGGLGDDTLKVVGLKAVNENTGTGETLWQKDHLRGILIEAAKNEVRVTIHSVCAGNEETLGLYQQANEQYPISHLRWGVIHQHSQTHEFIKINKDLGLVVNHELGFAFLCATPEVWYGQLFGAPDHPDRLIAPIPLYLEAGVPFSLNSDGGGANTQCSIWSSFYAAVSRTNWPGWGDEYSISREEALRAITMGGAYKLGMEDKIGSIEEGKLADLVVLSEDPLTCEANEICNIYAEMTILDGRIVYEAN